jgi:nucleotide-binding universal stress UspA family protein
MRKKLTPVNKILVPVDLSDDALCGVESALALSGEKKSQIYLLHVVARMTGPDAAAMEEFFTKKVRPLSKFACIVRSGEPAAEILKFAREEGIDLIVLPVGTGSPDGSVRAGGIADQVVRNAAVPVVVVKPDKVIRKLSEPQQQEREEKITMSYDERYLQEIRDRVCRKCIDRTSSGICVTSTYDSCAVNRFLPEIIDIVLNTSGDEMEPYVAKLRERVCANCGHQSTDGHCDMRDDVECALDRYFPLVVEAIQEVRIK